MGKQSNLIHAYTQALKLSKNGSYATRQAQLKTTRTIVEDLFLLRCAPHRWQELSSDEIRTLVSYWQSKGIKTETIAKKLSILRKICILTGDIRKVPSNKELGLLLRPSKHNSSLLTESLLTKIENSIIRSIVELEIHFGLTKSESIKLPEHSIVDDRITIYRDVAYNHYDRIISITTQGQYDALANRVQVIKQYNAQDNLLKIASFAKLSALYRCELAVLNITGHSHFRQIYATNRFEVLAKTNTSTQAIAVLQKELGLSSDRLLKVWVK